MFWTEVTTLTFPLLMLLHERISPTTRTVPQLLSLHCPNPTSFYLYKIIFYCKDLINCVSHDFSIKEVMNFRPLSIHYLWFLIPGTQRNIYCWSVFVFVLRNSRDGRFTRTLVLVSDERSLFMVDVSSCGQGLNRCLCM